MVTELKQTIIDTFKLHEGDTGSADVQVALLTARITQLTEHMRKQPKDFSSNRGLMMLVGKRRKLLDYIKSNDQARYKAIIERLGIRK